MSPPQTSGRPTADRLASEVIGELRVMDETGTYRAVEWVVILGLIMQAVRFLLEMIGPLSLAEPGPELASLARKLASPPWWHVLSRIQRRRLLSALGGPDDRAGQAILERIGCLSGRSATALAREVSP